MASQVVSEIARQLRHQNVNLRGKQLVALDKNSLRVAGRGKNVDIRYNKSRDLYDVKVHRINQKDFSVKTKSHKDVYFDSLPNFFNKKIK